MKIYEGILKRIDIGAGGWQLLCTDGTTYDLYGDIPQEFQDQKVKIKAQSAAGVGFMMGGGQALSVSAIEKS